MTLAVESIDDRVEEEAEWCEPEAVWKMHYRVTLEDGRQVAVFRNMKTGGWYYSPRPGQRPRKARGRLQQRHQGATELTEDTEGCMEVLSLHSHTFVAVQRRPGKGIGHAASRRIARCQRRPRRPNLR